MGGAPRLYGSPDVTRRREITRPMGNVLVPALVLFVLPLGVDTFGIRVAPSHRPGHWT